MKKGCFLSAIFALTFLIGIGFYIVKNYGSKIVYLGKEKLFELVVDDINKRIDELEQSAYQDSLKFMIQEYIHEINKDNFENAIKEVSDYFKVISKFINDKTIDSLEFRIIKEKTVK